MKKEELSSTQEGEGAEASVGGKIIRITKVGTGGRMATRPLVQVGYTGG